MNQQQQEPNEWICIECQQNNVYYYNKCKQCGTKKEQFYHLMRQEFNTPYNKHFKTIAIVDCEYNEANDCKEILEFLVCYIQLNENDHKVVKSRQVIIKPQLIPLIQNKEFKNITQEQADNGITLIEILSTLEGDAYIFENSDKACHLQEQCKQLKIECPINKFIDLHRVFPMQTGFLNAITMMKQLKIPFEAECYGLAEVVDELLSRGYRFEESMQQTIGVPVPEEESRLIGFEYLIVIDYEATCTNDQKLKRKFLNEIIEFPAVVYDIRERKIINQFQRYVKPVEQPILSQFCTELTGITQEQVDGGIPLEQAIAEYLQFINGLGRSIVITCGDFDMNLLKKEATRKNIDVPMDLRYYINIKKVFPKGLRNPKHLKDPCMVEMLKQCELELVGRHHSGIDDAINITRVCDYMISRCDFTFDERMISYSYKI